MQPLAVYLLQQVEAAMAQLEELPDERAIHQTRVAIRRLRSTVRVFAELLDLTEEERARADEELSWFAGLLGEVRDRQVQRDRFIAVLADLPAEDVPEESVVRVATLIEQTLLTEERAAARLVEETLSSERCRALCALLQAWRAKPPVRESDSPKAHRREVKAAAKKAARKADKRVAGAVGGADDAALHRARKAAKRARYAAEVLAGFGSGRRRRQSYKRLQDVLGAFQDAVVAQETTRRLAQTIDDSECGFVLGVLYAEARDHADDVRRQARRLVS